MRLRRLMDDELFVRGPQGLQPTQRALELAEPISVALGDIQRTLEFTQGFDPARSGMSFTLGLSSHAETVILPRLMAILSDRAPGVDLRVRSFTGRDDAIRMLDAGEVDVSVGIPPSATARILTARLFQERFVCVVRKDHPFALRPLDPKTFQALAHVVVSPENEGIDVADAALASKGWVAKGRRDGRAEVDRPATRGRVRHDRHGDGKRRHPVGAGRSSRHAGVSARPERRAFRAGLAPAQRRPSRPDLVAELLPGRLPPRLATVASGLRGSAPAILLTAVSAHGASDGLIIHRVDVFTSRISISPTSSGSLDRSARRGIALTVLSGADQ